MNPSMPDPGPADAPAGGRRAPARREVVRIGGASGAWGDSPGAIGPLLGAGVDYLMMDYLAEVTMSLLARAREKDPAAGYPPDFVAYLEPHLAEIARLGVKVASNAGGVNPRACKAALEAACARLGVVLRVAVVEGDDLMPQVDALRAEGVREWRSGEPLPSRLLTANAYLGAGPIAAALAAGADIVVTGRCVDSALALGILMHEFGWPADAHDLLAAGSLAGHLLECGPQVTGGVFTDWHTVPDWHDIGYPIAECRADGSAIITKPAGTGGRVNVQTVAEQALYEVGDPADYRLPDVRADFSQLRLEPQGPDRVRVSGARGRAPTPDLKVCATFQDGWRSVALVVIIGHEAVAKAERTARALVERGRSRLAEHGFGDFGAVHVEVLGAEASYGAASRARGAREVVLRLVLDHPQARALNLVARELGSVGLGFAQGTAALVGGRPKAVPVVRLYSFLLDKQRLAAPRVQVGEGAAFDVPLPPAGPPGGEAAAADPGADAPAPPPVAGEAWVEVPLRWLAHARSGDKGDSSNIAVFCRDPRFLPHLRAELTPARVLAHFAGAVEGPVVRYEAPGLHAFNFVLERALGGGGMASRRIDPQGKAYGQRLLEMTVRVPRSWAVDPVPPTTQLQETLR